MQIPMLKTLVSNAPVKAAGPRSRLPVGRQPSESACPSLPPPLPVRSPRFTPGQARPLHLAFSEAPAGAADAARRLPPEARRARAGRSRPSQSPAGHLASLPASGCRGLRPVCQGQPAVRPSLPGRASPRPGGGGGQSSLDESLARRIIIAGVWRVTSGTRAGPGRGPHPCSESESPPRRPSQAPSTGKSGGPI